jgi:hypothetical protein
MIGFMTVLTLAGRKLLARSFLSFAGLAAIFVLAFPSAGQIPALLDLSPGVAAAHPELVQERATLVAERQVLRSRTGTQNAQCSSVEEGSALEATCRESLSRLNTDVSAHIAKSNSFNAAVQAAEAALPVKGSEESGQPGEHAFARVEARGQFYFLTRDGRKLTGQEANRIPLEDGGKIVTGSDSRVTLTLPDETTVHLGPYSELEIDRFVYDPATDAKTVMVRVIKGVFRLVSGKVAGPAHLGMKVTLPSVAIGIRGTDFEAAVLPDRSGVVKLYSGQLQITELKTGRIFLLNAGEKFTFDSDGNISQPKKTQ